VSHRAQQIIDAVVANLTADTAIAWHVYRNRTATLAIEELELPAVSVVYGADRPLNVLGASNVAFLDSLIEISVVLVERRNSEPDLFEALLAMRVRSHIALIADRTQGLPFVIDTRYGGTDPVNLTDRESMFSGALVTHWPIHYRMNLADPS
jgi:hypothetical protein